MKPVDENARLVLDASRAYGLHHHDVYDAAQSFVLDVAQRFQDLELDPDAVAPEVVRAILATIREPMPPWTVALHGIWDRWHDRMHTVVALAFRL